MNKEMFVCLTLFLLKEKEWNYYANTQTIHDFNVLIYRFEVLIKQ
jgi:hypothetical protein